jgi:hypothetical protein
MFAFDRWKSTAVTMYYLSVKKKTILQYERNSVGFTVSEVLMQLGKYQKWKHGSYYIFHI